MSLPLVDFVHVDDTRVVATDIAVTGGGSGAAQADIRTLNVDPHTGGRSLVVALSERLHLPRGHWSCDVEVLVLDGAVQLGGDRVERYGYLFIPAGVVVGALGVAADGATALIFTSGTARLTAATEDIPGAARHRLVGPVHAADVAWERPRTKDFPAGAGRKTLREDPEAAQGFWLLGVLPHWDSPATEWHTFAEENYILEGEIETAVGVMTTGAYLSHPAGEHTVHGPMRSRTGSLLITRAIGPMGTTYEPSTHLLRGAWR